MNPASWLVLAAVAVLFVLAVVRSARHGSSCGGDCAHCSGGCSGCPPKQSKRPKQPKP